MMQLWRPSVAEIEHAVNANLEAFHPSADYADMSTFYHQPGRIALAAPPGIMLFVPAGARTYEVHYCFYRHAKGIEQAARQMLNYMFTIMGATGMFGLTPADNRAARILNFRLGAEKIGSAVDSEGRRCDIFHLSVSRWRAKQYN